MRHRFDVSTNFYRSWQEYKVGFENVSVEFQLGINFVSISLLLEG